MIRTHDLVVIGGGSAGYAAARTARDAGCDVAIVDHGPLGGLCILRGCMPTKTLLRSSSIMALMRRSEEFGLDRVHPRANLTAIHDRKARLIEDFAQDRIHALRDTRFTLYQERAMFLSPTELQAGTYRLHARAFIIATGSRVADVPLPGLKEANPLTSDDVLELRDQPETMVVLGGGPVGTELAQFFARIGTSVSLIQRSPRILSQFDEDLVRPVEACFRQEGIALFTDARLSHISSDHGRTTVHFWSQGRNHAVSGDILLHAMGRRPNIDGLHLEAAKVKVVDGRILVDETMRTSQPHIFAVGDVNGLHEIVHIAIQQGEIAGWNAVHPDRSPRRMDARLTTAVVFTEPQVASVGLSERACRQRGIAYLSASYPFNDHGKSLCMGETHGHVKLLCHPQTGEILGGHIVGPEASELIHEVIAIMYYRGTVHDIVKIPHYHPTLAEILTYPAEALIEQLKS